MTRLAFHATLTAALRADSHGKSTITKLEAERALKALTGVAAGDGAKIVQSFLDGKDAGSLSEKARSALVDFVAQQSATSTGSTGSGAVDVKASAARGEKNLEKAQKRLEALLASGRTASVKDGLVEVESFLDQAAQDIGAVKHRLKELATASAQIGRAQHELDALLAAGNSGVTKAELVELRRWLALPMPELKHAMASHPSTQPHITIRYPSDHEDIGGGGGRSSGTIDHTMKYPSDNEDGGGTPVSGPPKERKATAAHVASMKRALESASPVAWHKGGVVEGHLGERFARVDLGKGVSGFIPLGALTPTATPKDPNKVTSFYVERENKKTGAFESFGPLSIK